VKERDIPSRRREVVEEKEKGGKRAEERGELGYRGFPDLLDEKWVNTSRSARSERHKRRMEKRDSTMSHVSKVV